MPPCACSLLHWIRIVLMLLTVADIRCFVKVICHPHIYESRLPMQKWKSHKCLAYEKCGLFLTHRQTNAHICTTILWHFKGHKLNSVDSFPFEMNLKSLRMWHAMLKCTEDSTNVRKPISRRQNRSKYAIHTNRHIRRTYVWVRTTIDSYYVTMEHTPKWTTGASKYRLSCVQIEKVALWTCILFA